MFSRTLWHGIWYSAPWLWLASTWWHRLGPISRCILVAHLYRLRDVLEDNIARLQRVPWIQSPSIKGTKMSEQKGENNKQLGTKMVKYMKLVTNPLKSHRYHCSETNTSVMVSAPNSFLHWSISDHICLDFSRSNFLALRNLFKCRPIELKTVFLYSLKISAYANWFLKLSRCKQ